jgi:sortase A
MDRVAERGGPAGRAPDRGGRRVVAPGTGPRKAGSSPLGGALSGLALGLAAAGLWLAGGGFAIHAKAALAQVLLQQAWQYTQVTGAPLRPWPWADTRPLARLAFGDHGPDLFVLAGASGRTLAFGPGHHDDSALPGTSGNAVVSAHRDTHFRILRDLAVGDAVTIERPDGVVVVYRVRSAAVVDHRNLVLPRHPATPMLTLITCYPFDAVAPGTPLRYVVVATAE